MDTIIRTFFVNTEQLLCNSYCDDSRKNQTISIRYLLGFIFLIVNIVLDQWINDCQFQNHISGVFFLNQNSTLWIKKCYFLICQTHAKKLLCNVLVTYYLMTIYDSGSCWIIFQILHDSSDIFRTFKDDCKNKQTNWHYY